MRTHLLTALSLLLVTSTAAAAVAPLACPSSTSKPLTLSPSMNPDQDLISVDIYQGTTWVTGAAMMSLAGSWTPFSVSREQNYTAARRTDSKADKTLVTPGVASEGLTLMVRTDPASADQHTVSYAITLSKIDKIVEAGPTDDRIMVAQQTKAGPFCGQVTLKIGESETFPLSQDGLVARIKRHALPF